MTSSEVINAAVGLDGHQYLHCDCLSGIVSSRALNALELVVDT
jgi:hypothetical protein